MRFRMSIIAIVFALCMILSGCTWVTSGNIWDIKFFPVEDYEVRRLVEVFGDEVLDHVDSGRLTDDEYQALMAYQAGTEHLLQKYSHYMHDIKIESFTLMPDDTYEIGFTHDGTPYTCRVCPGADGFICSDDFEPPGQ